MSQTPAEPGGGGSPSHIQNKFFQQPVQAPVGSNFLSQGQGGTQYGGSMVPHFPVKPTNPHMGNGFRPHGPLQFNMHSSHMNPLHQHIPVGVHQMNNMKGRNDCAPALQQQYQQNHCGNVQYFPGGNYVTTVTVNPSEQHHQNHLPVVQPMQQQYMHNSQNYYMNGPGNAAAHTMQPANMKYIQNPGMLIQAGKDIRPSDNSIRPCQAISARNFNTTVISEPQIPISKECRTNENSSPSVSTSPTNQNIKCSSNNSKGTLSENINSVASNVISKNSALKNNSNPSNVNKNCSSMSGSAVLVSNRPRTSSRCDSVRSETGDSSCSSLSTDSAPEQPHNIHHPNAQPCNKSNSQQHLNFSPLQFPNNQMQQPINNFKNNMSNSGNANYQNYMGCQSRMNQVVGKPMYNNPNVVQAFQHVNTVQHVQLQHGQVQFMQQQYQSLQGQGVGRQSMGMIPNNLPQGQQTNSVMVPAGTTGSSMQGHNMPNTGIIPSNSSNNSQNQNLSMPQNCVGHSGGSVSLQNFSASETHGHYPPNQTLIHPQGKFPPVPGIQQPNMIIGMAGPISGGANPVNKGFPVIVPFGWKRIMHNGQIVYVSPSGSELRSPIEVCEYLTQENTCKCGLQCPLRVENVFCFDPKVPHRLTMPDELSSGEATKVCNHRRKLALAFSHHLQKQAKKEDGRKKRKRKAAEALESQTPSPTPTPSPAICQPPASQMVPFNPQSQQTQTGVSQMQYQMQHPMHQQQHNMYQPTPNQNWNGMYGVPRVMLPGGGMAGVCQGTPENYPNAGMGQGACAPSPTAFGGQNCCDNHHCMGGHQGARPPFAGAMNRPPLCRMPSDAMFRGMVPSQGGQHMQQLVQYNMMGANRPPSQAMNNNMCRMPMGVHPMPHMFGNGGMGMQGADPSISGVQEATKMAQPEEGEKRRKTSNPRSRKKGKQAAERNLPCPSVDARSLRTENAISPHTGPGPPFPASYPQGSSDPHAFCPPNGSGSTQTGSGLPVTGPSFMEDPNGYLAQQTALLNNTMAGGGVGQFSPQGARLSPRPSGPAIPSSQNSPLPPKISQALTTRGSALPRASPVPRASPAVVPLPSNVPLPARVSKASTGIAVSNPVSGTLIVSSPSSTTCTSVHSKVSTSASPPVSAKSCQKQANETDQAKPGATPGTCVATAESSFVKHTVTVTYTRSSVTTTTCRSESNSPHSSQDTDAATSDIAFRSRESPVSSGNKTAKSGSNFSSSNVHSKSIAETHNRKKSDIIVPDFMSAVSCRSNSNTSSGSSLSAEAANKPLTPGPAESSMNTQSPLEMVQNIVSSIPLPASSDELTPMPTKMQHNHHQPPQLMPEQQQPTLHPSAVPHQQVIGSHVYNMANGNNMTGVMYNANGATPNMLRGAGPLVVHGPGPQGSIPPGVIVTNSGSMVVVTSPFNSKGSGVPPAPVVCSNVTGIAPMVGVQTMPQVQVQPQPTLTNVQSHQLQHLQQIQPVQPVVQFVNTFATMQTPVIIQNGSNLPVLGPASLIPSSTAAFVTSQPLLAVDSTSHSSHLPMTHVVTSAPSEASDDSAGSRLTPVATPASTPTTPGSTHGSETPPSGGSGSGGRKRKRRRNTSTPGQPQQHNIMPAIIMSKPQQMVMNSSQIPQVTPYGGAHVATVATMSANGTAATTGGQMITAAGQPTNPINVVQMVGGPVAGPLPVHVQQPHTILVPSAAAPGVIINQLPDGTFVSTDHSSGVTYPVHLQLSGSHIVGVTPVAGSNPPSASVVASIAPSLSSQGAMVAVRPPQPAQVNPVMNTGAKIINISPTVPTSDGEAVNVYGVNPAGQGYSPGRGTQVSGDSLQQPLLVGTGNATLLQRKTTTIVAQQTTVVATQGGLLMGTHSSVSTQTPGQIGESDVSSSDCVANRTPSRGEAPYTSPSHQSAEVTTTRQDEDYVSPPASLLVSPHGHASPESSSVATTKRIGTRRQEPHSAMTSEIMKSNESVVTVFWGFHRGHHYWPCRVLHQFGGETTVRWFGDGAVESVPASSLSSFPSNARKVSTRRSFRGRSALDEAIAEASEAVSGGCNPAGSPKVENEAVSCTSIAEDQAVSPTMSSFGTPSSSASAKTKKRRKQRL